MIEKIIAILSDIGPTNVLLGCFLITIMLSLAARAGMVDAFFFHKSKRQKKDDWKNLTVWQKVVLFYATLRPTNAPRHMKLFWCYRIVNGMFLVSACVLVWLAEHICASLKPYAVGYMLLKEVFLDIPFLVYALFCNGNPDNPKGWNFDFFKRP